MNSGYSGSCFGRYLTIALFPTLIILAVGANYFEVINFVNIHIETLYILLFIYLIFLIFIPHNAYIAECKIKKQFDTTKNELENSLETTSLTIGGHTKSVLSVREFLEGYFKSVRDDNFAKVASSVFPMLGILGTFIAIAISMPDFTANNTKELDSEISKLLSGVGTAFYASIFGIFLSLLWTFFEKLGLSKIERYTQALEDIYSKYIWSQRELLKFKYDQKAVRDNELINALKDTFNLDFIKEINREHLKSYETIIDKTNRGLREIEGSLIKEASKLEQVVTLMQQNSNAIDAKESLEKNIQEFNNSAKELHKLLSSFDLDLDKALKKVDTQLATSVKELQSVILAIKSLKE